MKKLITLSILLTTSPAFGAKLVPVPFKMDAEHLLARQACTSQERWDLTKSIPTEAKTHFETFLNKKLPAVRAFAEAMGLRQNSVNPEVRALAEYWISRSLYEQKIIHTAFEGFNQLAASPITNESAGAQIAALECILEISAKYPNLTISDAVAERLPEYSQFTNVSQPTAHTVNRNVIWLAAANLIVIQVGNGKATTGDFQKTLAMLKNSGIYENFGRGLFSAKQSHHPNVVVDLEKVVASVSVPKGLKRWDDVTLLLLARSLFKIGKYDRATVIFRKIQKNSNELAESLSELAWSFLMADRYNEAIGTAISLQVGGLRNTFTPEASMVMAMSLNELCQYPESVQAVHSFRKQYEKSYRWLRNNDLGNLYPKAISFIKRKKTDVPERIGGEWVRSPFIASNQEEINLLFEESDLTSTISKMGSRQQRIVFNEIMEFAKKLKPKYKLAKMKMKQGEPLPKTVGEDLSKLKSMVRHFKRVQNAAPVWKVMSASIKQKAPKIQAQLVAQINNDLARRSVRMLGQLNEVAENIQLVEVEIYSGASQDIIWQNAHPEYKEVAEKLKNEHQKVAKEKTWDWGHISTGGDENAEIWEDELGSMKADLFDNCSSKDKFLALKRIRAEGRN
jgi:tetratricopeptide (TPR) repeat protein